MLVTVLMFHIYKYRSSLLDFVFILLAEKYRAVLLLYIIIHIAVGEKYMFFSGVILFRLGAFVSYV